MYVLGYFQRAQNVPCQNGLTNLSMSSQTPQQTTKNHTSAIEKKIIHMTLPISLAEARNKRLYYHSGHPRKPTESGFSFYSQFPCLLARPNPKNNFITTNLLSLKKLLHTLFNFKTAILVMRGRDIWKTKKLGGKRSRYLPFCKY